MPSILKLLLYCTIHYVMVYLLKVVDIALCEKGGMFCKAVQKSQYISFFSFCLKSDLRVERFLIF